jgi:hypothetical protein
MESSGVRRAFVPEDVDIDRIRISKDNEHCKKVKTTSAKKGFKYIFINLSLPSSHGCVCIQTLSYHVRSSRERARTGEFFLDFVPTVNREISRSTAKCR